MNEITLWKAKEGYFREADQKFDVNRPISYKKDIAGCKKTQQMKKEDAGRRKKQRTETTEKRPSL